VGAPEEVRALRGDLVEVEDAGAVGGEEDARSVRKPGGLHVEGIVVGEAAGWGAALQVEQMEVAAGARSLLREDHPPTVGGDAGREELARGGRLVDAHRRRALLPEVEAEERGASAVAAHE